MSDKPEQTAAAKLAETIARELHELGLINEPEDVSAKWYRCREVIEKHLKSNPLPRLPMSRDELEEKARSASFRWQNSKTREKGLSSYIIDAFAPYLSSEQPQPASQSFGEKIVDAMEGFSEEVEGPEVENFRGEWNKLRSGETPDSFTDSLRKFAQHFQQRGWELGRKSLTFVDSPECFGCGKPLVIENAWMCDGCPCNSSDGVNNLNLRRWKLLGDLQQQQARQIESLTQQLVSVTKEKGALSILASVHMEQIRELQAELDRLKSQPAQPITAIAGPPSREALEAAGDDDLWFVWYEDHSVPRAWKKRDFRPLDFQAITHHVPLGPITPPAPSTEQEGMPTCPVCGDELQHEEVYTQEENDESSKQFSHHHLYCQRGIHEIHFRSPYKQSAISAARSAGKGE